MVCLAKDPSMKILHSVDLGGLVWILDTVILLLIKVSRVILTKEMLERIMEIIMIGKRIVRGYFCR